jgi:hypothetical protein
MAIDQNTDTGKMIGILVKESLRKLSDLTRGVNTNPPSSDAPIHLSLIDDGGILGSQTNKKEHYFLLATVML